MTSPQQIIESDDSSQSFDSPHIHQPTKQSKLSAAQSNFIPKQLELLLKNIIPDTKMTSLESMAAAQLAAFQRLQAVPDLNQLNPLYTSKVQYISREIASFHFFSNLIFRPIKIYFYSNCSSTCHPHQHQNEPQVHQRINRLAPSICPSHRQLILGRVEAANSLWI